MDKREAILDAAEHQFYEAGFHATGIDRIVAAAAVTPRTLYRHFRSKEALVQAVLERREARFMWVLDETLEREVGHEADRWREFFARLGAWFRDEGAAGCLFLKALGEYGCRNDAIAQQVLGYKQALIDGLRQRLRASGVADSPAAADGLLLLLEGAVAMAPVLGGDAAWRRAADSAARLLATHDTT